MSVELNHTIVFARDNRASAEFLAGLLGLEVGEQWGPFIPVATGNGVTLDFATGGRGVYFLDPSGHGMEVLTQPYDSHR